jgi:hypothetical protein
MGLAARIWRPLDKALLVERADNIRPAGLLLSACCPSAAKLELRVFQTIGVWAATESAQADGRLLLRLHLTLAPQRDK